MNKAISRILTPLIFTMIVMQLLIYYYDNKTSSEVFFQKNTSVENFSSIVLSKSGITKVGSEKLNRINENEIYLQGKSYLENKDYKIYGSNIFIDMNNEISKSNYKVEIINSMGVLKSEGFKNIDSQGKIYFNGITTFVTHD